MYHLVTIVDNAVVCNWNLLRVELQCSHPHIKCKYICEVIDVLTRGGGVFHNIQVYQFITLYTWNILQVVNCTSVKLDKKQKKKNYKEMVKWAPGCWEFRTLILKNSGELDEHQKILFSSQVDLWVTLWQPSSPTPWGICVNTHVSLYTHISLVQLKLGSLVSNTISRS